MNRFEIIIPLLRPYSLGEPYKEIMRKRMLELDSVEGFHVIENLKISYKCEMLKTGDDTAYKDMPSIVRPNILYKITLNIPFKRFPFIQSWDGKECPDISDEESYRLAMQHEIQNFVYQIAFTLGISSNGMFDIGESLLFYNGKHDCTLHGCLNNFSSLAERNQIDVSKLNEISVGQSLSWILSNKDVVECCGQTPLGKGLSFFSRMFSHQGEDEDFYMCGLLAVIALEALYETNGNRNDLTKKIATFLEHEESSVKKQVERMYNHRNSIAHGGFMLPFRLNTHDCTNDIENAFEKVSDVMDIGLNLLLNTYQKMIALNLKALKFEYKHVT